MFQDTLETETICWKRKQFEHETNFIVGTFQKYKIKNHNEIWNIPVITDEFFPKTFQLSMKYETFQW